MKACVLYGARDLRIEDRSLPEVAEDAVRVAFRAGGICGSDLHYYSRGQSGPFRVVEPLVLGHELAGQVVAAGSAVHTMKPGDRVAINPSRPCRQCSPCREGRENLCRHMRYLGSASVTPHSQGGFQEYLVVAAEQCVPIPDTLSFEEAAFAEPLSVALHGVKRAGNLLGRRALITGCGPVGILIMLAAKAAGARQVVITDILDEPLALAKRLGADEAVNVSTQAEPMDRLAADKGQVDVAIEAAGSVQALQTCLRCVRPGGRVVQFGNMPLGDHPIALNTIMSKELEYVGAFRFDREFLWAIEYLGRGLINVKPLLTRRCPLAEAVAAFEFASDRRRAGKVQLVAE